MTFGDVDAERRALEGTYEDRCTVTRAETVVGADGIARSAAHTVAEGLRCGLSRRGGTSVLSGRGDSSRLEDGWQRLEFDRMLFLSPEADVRPGDGVAVTHLGETTRFTVVGESMGYASHRQVPLKFTARSA